MERVSAAVARLSSQNGSVRSGCASHGRNQGARPPNSVSTASAGGSPLCADASRRLAVAPRTIVASRPVVSWCRIRSLHARKPWNANAPLLYTDAAKSCGATSTTAARSSGGGSAISVHWVQPR